MGLQRKKVTVHGRHGTYQRSVLMRADKPKVSSRLLMREDTGVKLGHGMASLGSAIGSHVGGHYGAQIGHEYARAHGHNTFWGGIGGSMLGGRMAASAGRQVGKTVGFNLARGAKMRESTERHFANAAHLGAVGVRAYSVYKTVKSVRDHLKAVSAYRNR